MTFSEAFESIPLKINTPKMLCLLFKRVKSFGIFSYPKCPLSWKFFFSGRVCLAGMKKMARKRREGDLTVGKFQLGIEVASFSGRREELNERCLTLGL